MRTSLGLTIAEIIAAVRVTSLWLLLISFHSEALFSKPRISSLDVVSTGCRKWLRQHRFVRLSVAVSSAVDSAESEFVGDAINAPGRRKHRNKYAHLSSGASDPLVDALQRAEKEERDRGVDLSAPVRGTTVPTLRASPHIPRGPASALSSRRDRRSADGSGAEGGSTRAQQVRKRRRLLGAAGKSSTTQHKHMKEGEALQQGERVSVLDVVPSDPYTFGYVRIGRILGAHGVRGELKAQLQSDFLEMRIGPGSALFVKKPNRRSPRAVRVVASRPQSDSVHLLRFEHITSRLGAAAFKQYDVYVRASDRPELGDGEYLIRDLVGMKCFIASDDCDESDQQQQQQQPVAVVVGVVPADELCGPAAAHLMHAQLELQLLNCGPAARLCLVPLVPQIVPHVDVSARRLLLKPPPGLLRFTYQPPQRKKPVRGLLPQSVERLTARDRGFLRVRSVLRFAEGGECTDPPQLLL